MSERVHHILASYDIHDPRRLIKVGKAMKDFGERVLKSVFECNLTSDQFRRMKDRIDELIDHTEDSVRFYFVCGKCAGKVDVSGLGEAFVEDERLIIT